MDVTPQSLRDVRFREKLRGYHTDDVDAFVARVADVVEQLQQRITDLEGGGAGSASPSAAADAEESLRRTLVLAQRTADLAVQEARQEAERLVAEASAERDRILGEATAEHERVRAEVDDLRTRVQAELEQQLRLKEESARARRAALLADVAALEAHVERERERLRVYFSDQLRTLEEGGPTVAAPPEMQVGEEAGAGDRGEAAGGPAEVSGGVEAAGGADDAGGTGVPEGEGEGPPEQNDATGPAEPATADAAGTGGDAGQRRPSPYDELDEEALAASAEDDPFLAELRQAVADTSPLGPRDDEQGAPDDDQVDLFRDRGAEGGRFGFRRRR